MILSMSGQAWLFLSTVGVGVLIGMFYDAFRVLRRTAPHLALAVQLEDLFFWIIVTGSMFYFMLSQNFGEVRLFSLMGAGCGAALYFATVSRYVIKFSVVVINFCKKVFATAFRIITFPFRVVFSWISPPIKKFVSKRRKGLQGLTRYGKIQMRKTVRNWFILRKKV